MKSWALAALLQLAIGKACDPAGWKACDPFDGDLPEPDPTPLPGPDPAPAPGPDPAPAPGPDPAPAPGPDPAPAPGPDPTPAPGPDPTTPAPDPTPDPTPAPDTTPSPSAGTQIRSNFSSFCVDLPGGDTSNGAMLQLWDCYGGETQQWSFEDGQLVYLPDPSKCVDLLASDTTPVPFKSDQLGLWDCNQGDSQMWAFDQDWGTIYLSSSKASDATKCASINPYIWARHGDPVLIGDCMTGMARQVWTVGAQQPVPDPAPAPAPAPRPDPTPVPGPDPAPAPGPGPTTPAPDPTPDPTTAPDTTPAPSAGMQIQSIVSSLCVDLPGGDTSNGALLWTWDCYGGETQQWSFEDGQLVYLPDPSKCVDLLGGDTTNGNRLGLWDCSQGDSQMWGFDQDWGTIYLSSSKASDATKCAQIGGENKGDPLVIWDCTVEPQQVWTVRSQQSSLAVV